MWKFILFIIIGSIIIWQLGLFNTPNKNVTNVNINETKKEQPKQNKEISKENIEKKETKKEETFIKTDALSNILSGKTKEVKIEAPKEKKEIDTNKLKELVKSETKSSSYQNMLESAANEDLKPDNAVKVKTENLAIQNKKSSYEEMLAKEAENSAGDNVVRLSSIKKPPKEEKTKEENLEKIETPKLQKDEKTAKVLLRENLKKLIMGAGIEIKDKKLASILEEETKTDNAVRVKPKSKEDLIKDVIKEISKNPKVKNSYVVGLLKEVSKSKMDIVSVTKEYTIVKIKEGDNLWNIAKQIYGNGFKYKLIYEANKDKLADPNVVPVGTIIKVSKVK